MKIDAHQHFWKIDRGDYGWMDESVAAIRRDYGPEHLAPFAEACGVGGTVLVQAAPTVAETEFLLAIAEESPLVQGVVGWIDLEGDVPGQLARIAHPALKSLRPMLQDIEDTEWLLRPAVVEGLRYVARAGLRFDALVTPRHLPMLERFVADVPELPVVIDHCAKQVFDGTDPGAAWREGMAALAAHPQVHCKLSGLANEYGPGWGAETLREVAGHVLDVFGPARVMWGSDWPVLELAGDYEGWFAAAQVLTRGLSEAERADVFGGTATRFYGLDG
ncbi:amidohydrolase family protein [Vannielia litorea]|uniref:amidohydrolase family protein n=1 Tax=Vannielia litorea TaxID=1217970 RepID=UPI001C9504A4|nr:amidohydrolase family protein [Vannielia litorea]MBY6048473.1 amidohydrolase family protein [Vannielia litorea]MBY6075887.1 amidohydrolase family protein [Vannielia litorea]